MSEVMINISEDVKTQLELQAQEQGISVTAYIEKLVRVKAFSATLDGMRNKLTDMVYTRNIANEEDLNKYLDGK